MSTASEPRDGLGVAARTSWILLAGGLLLGFSWALQPAVHKQNQAPCRPLEPEAREGAVPEFTVQDLEGNAVSSADLAGKFVVLNFWATWCEPCIREWPELDRLAERFADDEDVIVAAVSVEEDKSKIAPFLAGMGLSESRVRVLWDPTQSLHETLGSEKLPDTYFVNEDGELTDVFVNVRDWGDPIAEQCVTSRLGR